MLQRGTKAAAERLAEDRLVALEKHGREFSKIPSSAQREAAIAWSLLDDCEPLLLQIKLIRWTARHLCCDGPRLPMHVIGFGSQPAK